MASLSNINGIFDVHSTGAILFSTSHGTSGQILKSNGNAAPTWIPQSDIVGAYLPLAGGTLTGNLAINGTNTLTVGGVTTLNDHLKVYSAWSSSDLTQNSFYAQNATDGFAFGVGSDVSTWFSYDSTTGIGVKAAISVYNNASLIKIGVNDQAITMKGATTFDVGITGTTATFSGLVSGITPTAAANFATKAYVDAHPGSGGTVTSVATGNGLTGGTITSTGTLAMSGTYTGTFSVTDDLNVTDSARFEGTANPITIGDGFGYGGSATICKHNDSLYLQYNNGQSATNLFLGGGGTAVTIKDAQNSAFEISGSGVTYFTGGNVGISTTTPQSILSLSKTDESSYTPATAIDYSLMLGTRNGNAAGTSDDLGPGIVWKYNDSGGSYTKKSAGIMQVGEGNYLRSGLAFYTNNNANTTSVWSEKMRLSMDGDLGIGTPSPGAKLHVDGLIRIVNSTFAGFEGHNTNGTWECFIGTESGGGGNRYNSKSSQHTFYNNSSAVLRIDSSGNVGIATTLPGYKLDVNGTGNFSSYLKLVNAWSSSTLSANSFYVQNSTDGFAMGVGTGISSWFSWDNSAGQKRAIDVFNDGSSILVGAGGQNIQIQGTTTPLAPLSVDNNAIRMGRDWAIANRADIRLDSNGPSNPADILYGHTAAANQTSWTGVYWALSSRGSSASNRFYFYRASGNPTGSSEAVIMSFDPNMRVGINQVAPAYALDVTGTIRATGDIIAYSDARVKDNVRTIDNALEKVTKLRGVSYTRNDIEDNSTKIGVIAQEVLKVLPEVVEEDKEGKYSVAYGNIVGVLIESIKELEARVKELENK